MDKKFFKSVFVIAALVIAILAVNAIFVETKTTVSQPQQEIQRYKAIPMTAHRVSSESVKMPVPESVEELEEIDYDSLETIEDEVYNLWDGTTPVWYGETPNSVTNTWDGDVLNPVIGTVYGPTGKETYYNLPMDGVVSIMRGLGYSEEEYPCWEREDGCKMFGPYIMVAANLDHFPKGTIVECSLGTAMVCDTGEFAHYDEGWNWLDIAVNW